jgi:hypothetical protein
MARIRSIHPGLFTDEAFMTASPHARLLIIGIWTEAWDDGVFEWKPLTLKARLFPVDAVNVADLLAELAGLDFVKQFETGGKQYGAIRNFQKYQRPKKPNSSRLLPEHMREYVHQVPNQFPTSGEKSPQMEDGGWRGEEEGEDTASAASSCASAPEIDLIEAERRCAQAAGVERLGSFAPIAELLHRQADLERDVLPVIRSRPAAGGAISSWKFYVPIISERVAKREPPKLAQGPPKVHVMAGSAEWDAWTAHNGKSKPIDSKGGFYFPSRWPPTTTIPRKEEAA